MADAPSSEGGSWGFESPLPYQSSRRARVAQVGRGGILKKCTVRVRVSPRALTQGRSIKAMRQVPTLRSRQRDRCLFESGRPCQTFQSAGVYAKGKAGCPSNSRPSGFAGSSPATPARTFTLAVAQPGRAPRCDRGGDGFKSRRPTLQLTRGVSQAGLRRATLYRVSAGSNPARPANF
jgi:hypothetical protein